MNLPLDKLKASGWGSGKASKNIGGTGVIAMPSTPRSKEKAQENSSKKGNLEESINLEVGFTASGLFSLQLLCLCALLF